MGQVASTLLMLLIVPTSALLFNGFTPLQDPVDICVENGTIVSTKNFTTVIGETVRDVTDVFLTGNTAMRSPRIETADLSLRSDPTGEPAVCHLQFSPKTYMVYVHDLR